MEVAGVDGCKGGWVVVCADAGARLRIDHMVVEPDFMQVLAETQGCAAVAIDVPIGLMDFGMRLADREARRVLTPRASCVFPSAIRPVLGITDYYEACNVSFAVQGKRIPRRAFSLGLRSHEVDQLMSPELQQRVVEVHPEVCFWALNGSHPMANPKRTSAGQLERVEVLSRVFSDDLIAIETPARADRDDFLDACAAAWTAWRFATGQHGTLPANPTRDARGLRMEIVY